MAEAAVATRTTPRAGLVFALLAAVLIMGQFALPVEATELTDCPLNSDNILVVASDIEKIGYEACRNNKDITGIDFSSATSLTEIGQNAFGFATNVGGTLDFSGAPNLALIDKYAFQYIYYITDIDFSKSTSLTEIGEKAFYRSGTYYNGIVRSKDLTTLDLSGLDNLALIDEKAFSGCDALISVDVSDCPKLGVIGKEAFQQRFYASMKSFVARNVGTNSVARTVVDLEGNLNTPGALLMGHDVFKTGDGELTSLDFRGTAVGTWTPVTAAGTRLPVSWGLDTNALGHRRQFFSNIEQADQHKLSFQKCTGDTETLTYSCCYDKNGNDFANIFDDTYDVGNNDPAVTTPFTSPAPCPAAECASASGLTCDAGLTPVTTGTPSCSDDSCLAEDFESGGSCCEACAANCDSCDTAGAGKCDTCSTGYSKTADDTCEDIDGCAGNPACGADATCVDVAAPGTGYECQCDDGFLGDPVQNGNATCQAKAKCSEWSANSCSADQQVLSDTLFCQDTACTSDDGDTCCVARANCSTITCAAGTEAKTTSAASQLCAGATCDSATDDNDLCCQEMDGCAASPDCGTNATCADVEAPGTGHECRCDDGFTGTTTTDDTAATCTPVQLGGAALPSTSSAAVWIVSSIFASVFAVSSSGA